MSYVVTARKWRPMVFDDVVGQSHITTTLRNAIAINRLSHAYIFSGPRGVGKTTTARILAKAINCLHPKDFNPDNECELCKEITEGRSVHVFEIDGASNRGVDEIRNLREAVRYGPPKGKYKVYIIDEVHMLTKEAFNALLKTLEEPPPHILFVFATTEIHKVPLTILSRCQRFDFRRIAVEEIIRRLRYIAQQEKITISDDALLIIAKKADGSLRDALSIFDQLISFCGEIIESKQIVQVFNIVDQEFFFKVTDLIKTKDTKGALALVEEIITHGHDLREFLNGLNEHFRNLLVALTTGSTHLIETSEAYKKRYAEDAKSFSENNLLRLIKITSDTDNAIRWSQQPRLKLEVGLMQMVKMDNSIQIEQLLYQIEDLKKKLNTRDTENKTEPSPGTKTITSEVPVRGNVSASQPMLLPHQIVQQTPSYQFSQQRTTAGMPARIPTPHYKEQPIMKLTADEAMMKWPSLIDEARKERIALGTMLSETKLVNVSENRLQVLCPDDFHLDTLRRNREFISQLAEKVYGAKVRLEATLSSPSVTGMETTTSDSPHPVEEPKNGNGILQHPVVRALMREFGAEPVE